MNTDDLLTLDQVQHALERCMQVNPPSGGDAKILHPDASRIADVWAMMHVERMKSVPRADVKPSVLEAYTRWAISDA